MLGPYRTGRRLGGGGMGVVLEALDTVLNRRVALKVIAADLAGDPDFRARFTREAQAQASLDSPHVVHVYGHGEDDGWLWIATQLIPDGDLGAMIRAYGAPPARTGLDLVAQVASGLADAHAEGLIHRDIKPANVLLRRRPEGLTAYLGDFGIARRVGAEQTHATTGTVGTPTFMAPELHTGSPATPASDVYSLGCLLWVTLTGRAPYAGTSDYQVVAAHLGDPVPQLATDSPLAAAVNRILRSAMAKRPEDRCSSAATIRDQLRAALALPDAPAVDVPPRPTRRRLALVVAAAALLVVAALGSAWAFTRGSDGSPTAGDRTPTEPTSPTGTPAPTTAHEERAIASLAEALEAQGLMTAEQARCAARRWIQEAGLQAMVDAGFFDEDLQYVDRPQSELTPALQAAALSAVTACVTL
jgi:serine/threonine-protein kinase